MNRSFSRLHTLLFLGALLAASSAMARVKVAKLAEQLLFGDQPTRSKAVQDFNKLPPDAQERLVPDFMVALTDDDPQVRKIASRILKAMGVTTAGQIPDIHAPAVSTKTAEDKWVEEKKMKEAPLPDVKKELPVPARKPVGDDRWSDLSNMKTEESGNYADLKRQIDLEKKGGVTLDASQLRPDQDVVATPMSTVVESLKDSDPWVRSQAARRLAMIHPAPVDAIPTLIKMLGDRETESRRAAVAALGSFGHLAKDAVLPLNAAMSDPDPTVRALAEEALKQISQ